MTVIIRIPKGNTKPKKEAIKMAKSKSVKKRVDKILEGFSPYIPNNYGTRGVGKRVAIVGVGKNISISACLATEIGLEDGSFVTIHSKDNKLLIMKAQAHEANVICVKHVGKGSALYIYCRGLLLDKGVTASQSCNYEYLKDEDILIVTL